MVIILRTRDKISINFRSKILLTCISIIFIVVLLFHLLIVKSIEDKYVSDAKQSIFIRSNIVANKIINWEFENYRNNILIKEILSKEAVTLDARLVLLDRDKRVIVDSDKYMIERIFIDEISDLIGPYQMFRLANTENGLYIYTSVPVNLHGQYKGSLLVIKDAHKLQQSLTDLKHRIMMIYGFVVSVLVLIAAYLSRILTNPIIMVTKDVEKMIHTGMLNQRLSISGSDEVAQMVNAFNLMSVKLSHVDKQRKDFVANVSHELRTPLSSIKVLIEYLILQEEIDEDLFKEFLKDINSEIDRLNAIINSLLSLVDLDREGLVLNFEFTYINFMVEKVIKRLKPLAEKKNIEIIYNSIDKVQIKVDGDKLQQAVINILDNAIKYTKDGGQVTVEVCDRGKSAVIRIADTGIGIPNEDIEHIFERFYRVDTARARATGGTGLGLSISNQIIQLHGGHITVESTMGVGTTFCIVLPAN